MFAKTLYAGWGDMDFNAHMRNTAYLDKSADVRMLFFAEHGFPMHEFMRLQLGPVISQDTLDYFKELRLLEPIRVTLQLAGMSEDASRFLMVNEFYREDGKLAARVTSAGGWLDLAQRRFRAPPRELHSAMQQLHKSAEFSTLASALR